MHPSAPSHLSSSCDWRLAFGSVTWSSAYPQGEPNRPSDTRWLPPAPSLLREDWESVSKGFPCLGQEIGSVFATCE